VRHSLPRAVCALALSIGALRAEHLPVRIYTTTDGLAANTIDRIVEDSRGYLWFCTREGLSRFDGYQFVNFGSERGLAAAVHDLLVTPDGNYWLATAHGLVRFQPGLRDPRFEIYPPHGANPPDVPALAADAAGGVWVGTLNGLYHMEGKASHWQLRPVDIGMPREFTEDRAVESLLVDRDGALWIGARGGLYRRDPDGRCQHLRDGLPSPVVAALRQDREGRLWAGTWLGLCRISTGRALNRDSIEQVLLRGYATHAILEASDGQLWAATDRGLSKLHSQARDGIEESENYTAASGLGGTSVLALAEDRAGNLWLGAEGANRIARGGLITYGEQDGLESNPVYSIFEDRSGDLCVTTGSSTRRLIHRFDGRRFHVTYTPQGTIVGTAVTPVRGAALLGTSQEFVVTFTDSQGVSDFGVVNVLINNFIDGRQACYLAYVASTNTLILIDDAGDAAGPYAGTMALSGGSGNIQNSQCMVSGAGSGVNSAPDTLALTLNITFKAAFAGNRVIYAAGRDSAGGNNTGWQAVGTTTVQ